MINLPLGAPAFVGRLLPIYSSTGDLLYEQVLILIKLIHDAGGYVYLDMSDNLSVNQKMFKTFHSDYKTTNIFSIEHPVENTKFAQLYLFYDPTHLFKNIRNNWVSEKTQTFTFTDPVTKKE